MNVQPTKQRGHRRTEEMIQKCSKSKLFHKQAVRYQA
jgi:hypothetical protein